LLRLIFLDCDQLRFGHIIARAIIIPASKARMDTTTDPPM
jgi:hypothetical protein